MKLFGALADLASQQGSGATQGAAGLAGQAAAFAREVDDHLATGSAECRYCPVCRVVHAVRETSPEVKDHLTVAASSLLQAAAALLEPHRPGEDERSPDARGPSVERIDLDDADPEEAP